jgi:protein MpaA
LVTRLGKNINGYFGEVIDIAAVLNDCAAAATANGWLLEEIPVPAKPELIAFKRPAPAPTSAHTFQPRNIYISAGIHGDEPAGPLAARKLLQRNEWPQEAALFLLPCLNPTGFLLNKRENDEGIDLNRDYLEPRCRETKAHIEWLERQPRFELCLCLHEDWESHGFYIYEANPEAQPSLAETMIRAVQTGCPIDESEIIEGRPAAKGIIRPSLDPQSRPQWPEAFYLLSHKARLSYTLEAPSDFALDCRVSALEEAVLAGVRQFLTGPGGSNKK